MWRVRLNSDWAGYYPEFGNHPGFDSDAAPDAHNGLPASASLPIGPYTALIFSQ
jgi:1,4-alpha-glucan branching enzyme